MGEWEKLQKKVSMLTLWILNIFLRWFFFTQSSQFQKTSHNWGFFIGVSSQKRFSLNRKEICHTPTKRPSLIQLKTKNKPLSFIPTPRMTTWSLSIGFANLAKRPDFQRQTLYASSTMQITGFLKNTSIQVQHFLFSFKKEFSDCP